MCGAAREHEAVIARETLAIAVTVGGEPGDDIAFRKEAVLDGEAAVLGIDPHS